MTWDPITRCSYLPGSEKKARRDGAGEGLPLRESPAVPLHAHGICDHWTPDINLYSIFKSVSGCFIQERSTCKSVKVRNTSLD